MRAIVFIFALTLLNGCTPDTADVAQTSNIVTGRKTNAQNKAAVQYSAKCMPSAADPATIPVPPAWDLAHQDLNEPIIRYLRCMDFDCTGALQDAVKLGPSLVPQLSRLLQQGAPPELAAELPGNAARTVRLKAAAALGALKTPHALPPLIAALESTDPLLRAETARAVSHFEFNHSALTALLPLLRDPDPLVRETAAAGLKNIGCSAAVPELRYALQTEPADHIRSVITDTIRSLETP